MYPDILMSLHFVDWTGADEDTGDVNVWEDNWDDDNIEDDFSQQLRWVHDRINMGSRKFWISMITYYLIWYMHVNKKSIRYGKIKATERHKWRHVYSVHANLRMVIEPLKYRISVSEQ